MQAKVRGGRIAKGDVETFHDESWKCIYFGIERSSVKVTRNKTAPAWDFALLRVLASSSFDCFRVAIQLVFGLHRPE